MDALLEAGVVSVVYAVPDPNPIASGGAERLRAAGVDVTEGIAAEQVTGGPLRVVAPAANRAPARHLEIRDQCRRQERGRRRVVAVITSDPACADVHRRRAVADAIVVGTGTVLFDDPTLTARPGGVGGAPTAAGVVVGMRRFHRKPMC